MRSDVSVTRPTSETRMPSSAASIAPRWGVRNAPGSGKTSRRHWRSANRIGNRSSNPSRRGRAATFCGRSASAGALGDSTSRSERAEARGVHLGGGLVHQRRDAEDREREALAASRCASPGSPDRLRGRPERTRRRPAAPSRGGPRPRPGRRAATRRSLPCPARGPPSPSGCRRTRCRSRGRTRSAAPCSGWGRTSRAGRPGRACPPRSSPRSRSPSGARPAPRPRSCLRSFSCTTGSHSKE